jgi:hypothetical protein
MILVAKSNNLHNDPALCVILNVPGLRSRAMSAAGIGLARARYPLACLAAEAFAIASVIVLAASFVSSSRSPSGRAGR